MKNTSINSVSVPVESIPLRAAVLTARGRGAVATIRLVGENIADKINSDKINSDASPLFQAANKKPLAQQPHGRIVYGEWGQTVPEELVVTVVDETTIDVHCHGGEAAIQRILNDFRTIGGTVENWESLLTKTGGQFDADCANALSRAPTIRTAAILYEQQSGLLQNAYNELRDDLRTILSMQQTEDAKKTSTEKINALLNWSNFGRHLTQPWRVVIAGRPNAGKSSLINALTGYTRAIVSSQPGTTRDVVTSETAFGGWPVELSDTAGLRQETTDELETIGIERARHQLETADCRVILFDISQPQHPDDLQLRNQWPNALFVGHKSDLPPHPDHSQQSDSEQLDSEAKIVRVSSVTQDGIPELIEAITQQIIPVEPPPQTAIPITEQQINWLVELKIALQTALKTPHDIAPLEKLLDQYS